MGAAQLDDPVHTERLRRLKLANAVRSAKKELKAEIAVGKADAAELLLAPPPPIEKVRVLDFLTWLPWIGKARARQMLRSASQLPESTEIRKLSPATRERLADVVRSRLK